MHLWWQPGSRAADGWDEATVTVEVLEPPTVAALYFWALQVSFVDRGRRFGGAHLGLQWHPGHPGSTAVNWGGYDPQGRVLPGSDATLPSATGNPNTRDLPWEAGRPYTLRIARAPGSGPAGEEGWRGSVTDVVSGEATVVRDLWAGGAALVQPVVWSEVFAACDDPPTAVGWSELSLRRAPAPREGSARGEARREPGVWSAVTTVRVSYQAVGEGGCRDTDSSVEGARFVQRTATGRRTPDGRRLRLR